MKPLLLILTLAFTAMAGAVRADAPVPALNVNDSPFVTPAATPAPQIIVMPAAGVTPEAFQSTALKWIGTLAAILGAIVTVLLPAMAMLWTKLHDVVKRQDRQAENTGSLQAQVTSLAHDTPPPAATKTPPVVAIVCLLASCFMLTACPSQTLADARQGFLKSTDVSVSASYDGVTVSDTITSGRRKLGLNVDGKQIRRLQDGR